MRKFFSIVALAGLLTVPAFAADKEITITGEAKCAKCALHETDKCQNVIQTEEHGKIVIYYLTQNGTSKNFHDNVCKTPEKVIATGKVSEEKGKKILIVSKIKVTK